MGLGKPVVAIGQAALDFLKNLSIKSSGGDYGSISKLPYVQLGEQAYEGGRRMFPGSRAEILVPSGDMNPPLLSGIQSQRKDIMEYHADMAEASPQENRSPEQLRESIQSVQHWIDTHKDLPAFADMIYPMTQDIEKTKALLRSRTKPRSVE